MTSEEYVKYMAELPEGVFMQGYNATNKFSSSIYNSYFMSHF